MIRTTDDSSAASIRATLLCQALDLIAQERKARIAARKLVVDANKLTIQAMRLRLEARDRHRRARILAKDECHSPDDLQVLDNQERALLEQADKLHEQALEKLAQAMRLTANLIRR